MRTDSQIERLESLIAQAIERDILAHIHTAADLYAQLAQGIDLSLDHIARKLIGRNAVGHHATRLFFALEYGRRVPHSGKIVRTRKTRRPRTHDGDLLREPSTRGGRNDLRYVTILSLEILLGDEALHIIDRHRLVDRAARTSRLAALVADASTYRGKRILLLDERECIAVTPFSCHAQIALHRNMCRTGNLARCRASLMTLDTARILVIGIPVFFAPGKRG